MSIEAIKQALEALEAAARSRRPEFIKQAITALRISIEQAKKQKPAARLMRFIGKDTYPKRGYTVARTYEECPESLYPGTWEEGEKLYTTPPAAQRTWVGLTDAEIEEWDYDVRDVVMDIEKMLRDKNT